MTIQAEIRDRARRLADQLVDLLCIDDANGFIDEAVARRADCAEWLGRQAGGVISTINVTEEYQVDIPATPGEARLTADRAALMAAHAAGYAAAVADVVAWLMSRPGLNRCLNVATVAAAHIKDGAHVGAAKVASNG